jgi:hypothetical protein
MYVCCKHVREGDGLTGSRVGLAAVPSHLSLSFSSASLANLVPPAPAAPPAPPLAAAPPAEAGDAAAASEAAQGGDAPKGAPKLESGTGGTSEGDATDEVCIY